MRGSPSSIQQPPAADLMPDWRTDRDEELVAELEQAAAPSIELPGPRRTARKRGVLADATEAIAVENRRVVVPRHKSRNLSRWAGKVQGGRHDAPGQRRAHPCRMSHVTRTIVDLSDHPDRRRSRSTTLRRGSARLTNVEREPKGGRPTLTRFEGRSTLKRCAAVCLATAGAAFAVAPPAPAASSSPPGCFGQEISSAASSSPGFLGTFASGYAEYFNGLDLNLGQAGVPFAKATCPTLPPPPPAT